MTEGLEIRQSCDGLNILDMVTNEKRSFKVKRSGISVDGTMCEVLWFSCNLMSSENIG